jgi:ABC-type multidrug transport system permease subunit
MALVTPTEKVMDNLSTVVILVAAMLGGNMMPIDALPAWVHGVGRFVFNYWINLGFSNVVAKNRGLAEAPAPAVVLAAVTLLTLGLALAVVLVRRRRGGLA